MKIVLAFDSFKGCISAQEACNAASQGIRSVLPNAQTIEIPLSDGGEGLVNCIRKILPTKNITLTVHNPLMEIIEADYALSADGQTAYMEMAAAAGLTLIPESRRNPMNATTYGVGEMIADAIERGCTKIIMGIGGSATCDGGRGMIEALNHKNMLHTTCRFVVACDVVNPLFGPNGAAYVFAPQKGATPEQVIILDKQLQTFAHDTEAAGFATLDLANYPGAGAAGGLGYALLSYLKAELHSGIDIVMDITQFDKQIADANLIITGEGKSDIQTLMGKVPDGVLKHGKQANIPVWLLSGVIDDPQSILSYHFNLVHSINEGDPRPLSQLLQPNIAKDNLRRTVYNCICRELK